MQKYVFRPYSDKFPEYYQQEEEKLKRLLGDIQIAHIGSTAVPGLGGKGIVDVMISTQDPKQVSKILQDNGYLFVKEDSTKNRLFHQKDYDEGNRRVHIHITSDDYEWKEKVGFRDYLRENPEEMKKYEQLKKEGASICHGSKQVYAEHKKWWIDQINEKVIG